MRYVNLSKKSNNPLDIKYEISSFPDGQQNIKIIDAEFISYSKTNPVTIKSRLNDWKDLELICAINACLKHLEVPEIHLYVPYFLGSRSDRKFGVGENNYLKDVICPVINSQGFKSVTILDSHSDVLEACLNGFKKMSNLDLVKWALFDRICTPEIKKISDVILVSPDAGASKKIYKLAEQIGYKGDIITCSKDRDENGKLTKCIVPIEAGMSSKIGKDFIIIDDICDGGATFINIAKTIRDLGYKDEKIYLIVTHGIFSKGYYELSKYFDAIYCTNSYGETDMTNQTIRNGFKIKQLNVF